MQPSRNPYSRLYSAFINKVFLPTPFQRIPRELARLQVNTFSSQSSCTNNITFGEFLNAATETALDGKSLDIHWAPIFSFCNPCSIDVYALMKQETFSSDVEFVLKQVGVANEEFEAIHDAFSYDRMLEIVIPRVVKTELTDPLSRKGCMTPNEVAKRLWTAFQVQGYLTDGILFPDSLVNSETKAADPNFMTDLIQKTVHNNPLTLEESKQQRNRALVKAYKNVDSKTIERLIEVYKQDFRLFDYSFQPPSEVNV